MGHGWNSAEELSLLRSLPAFHFGGLLPTSSVMKGIRTHARTERYSGSAAAGSILAQDARARALLWRAMACWDVKSPLFRVIMLPSALHEGYCCILARILGFQLHSRVVLGRSSTTHTHTELGFHD